MHLQQELFFDLGSKIKKGSGKMIYIIRFKNKLLCFYHDGNCIMLKKFSEGKWSMPEIIFNNAWPEYTVNISDSQINLFCQNNSGNAFLCTYKNNNWQSKIILQNQFNYPLQIHPLVDKNNFSLIYNIPADKNNFYLVINKLKENRWQPSIQIDKLYGLENFCLQRLNDDHVITFYMTKSAEINLGYREITSANQSDFHIIHSTYYKITDTSFLTSSDSIHTLYTVKNMFTKQIAYCRKTDSFLKPIVLFENPNIKNNLLLIIKNDLYALWTVNEKIYAAISKDNGFTFSAPVIFQENNSQIQKAFYLSDERMREENFFCRQIYVNKNNPWQVKFLPNVQKKFYDFENAQQSENPTPKINTPQINEIISKLKNQLDLKNQQLIEKDKQIFNLTNLLKNKNDEIISLCSEKKNLSKKLISDDQN